MSTTDPIAAIAARHDLSEGAVRTLADAVARTGGRMAQWNHPDLGGMGQWSGGMIQIGDMFNNDLKARVGAALDDLSKAGPLPSSEQGGALTDPFKGSAGDWWPGDLGRPAASGAQNDMRYACFPEARRLAVRRDGKVTVYDTGDHRLTGVAQSQGGRQDLVFSGPDGVVTLEELVIVG